jgi:hypothetical protein
LIAGVPWSPGGAWSGASLSRSGHVATYSGSTGFPTPGAILLADRQTTSLLVKSSCTLGENPLHCGGGFGDPTPLGGTFNGLSTSAWLYPSVNSRGDVVFLADVLNGSSTRGLFLVDSASHAISTVAAVGDPAPSGGVIGAIGAGTLNDDGEVAFLAWRTGIADAMVLKWSQGSLTQVVQVGDAVPGGGTFSRIATLSTNFSDGTSLPLGPTPLMRPGGEVWFGGRYSSPTPPFQTVNAYFVSNGGVHTRIYGDGDPTLDGAVLKNPSEPVVNAFGEIALTSQSVAPGTNYSVFYRGRPGQ